MLKKSFILLMVMFLLLCISCRGKEISKTIDSSETTVSTDKIIAQERVYSPGPMVIEGIELYPYGYVSEDMIDLTNAVINVEKVRGDDKLISMNGLYISNQRLYFRMEVYNEPKEVTSVRIDDEPLEVYYEDIFTGQVIKEDALDVIKIETISLEQASEIVIQKTGRGSEITHFGLESYEIHDNRIYYRILKYNDFPAQRVTGGRYAVDVITSQVYDVTLDDWEPL